jgi:hypothetical protein
MNQDQAKARARALVTNTVRSVAPDVQTTVDQSIADWVGDCFPPNNDKVTVRFTMNLAQSSADRNTRNVDATKAYWQRQGYHILSVIHSPDPQVLARTQDGFDLSYVVSNVGSSFLNADSPCVTPTGPSPSAP